MLRVCSSLLIFVFIQVIGVTFASAQAIDPRAREAEWKGFKLPPAEFTRAVVNKTVLFRAPAGWEHRGYQEFKGPHETQLRVIVEKVPSGIPLKSYTNAVLQGLRNVAGGADSLTARRTEISGLEAREFFMTLPDLRGESTRRMIWSTVSGPNAISFVFVTPEANAAETEPYFKAVIESSLIFESDAEYELFERLRSAAIKDEKPLRVDNIRSLVDTIKGFNDSARAKAVEALVSAFDSSPDSAVELLFDRDPIVRGSAIEAVGRSSNRGLDSFLVRALADQSAAVAVRAARSLAKRDDIIKLLRDDSANWEGLQTIRLMRTMPFLNDAARNQLVDELMRYKSAAKSSAAGKRGPVPPPPPPVARTSPPAGKSLKNPQPDPATKLKSLGAKSVSAGSRSYAENEGIVLDLLPDLDALVPTIPAAKLLDGDWGSEGAMQLALDSRTRLPVDSLLGLLSTNDRKLTRLVLSNLAISAVARDISRIETVVGKMTEAPNKFETEVFPAIKYRPLADELRTTTKRIRWREKLEAADAGSREALFKEAFADADLSAWSWPYVRDLIEAPGPRLSKPLFRVLGAESGSQPSEKAPAHTVSPLGENLLPASVMLYTAIPDAQVFIDKLGESLSSVQLDSARTQAKLTMFFKIMETQIARSFGVPDSGNFIESSGLRPHSPVIFARWTADGAPRGLSTAQRKAMIFRVQDRDRFEQLLAAYHSFARFEMVPEYVSAGARFLPALPAIMPLAASAISASPQTKSEPAVIAARSLIGYERCAGYPVTVFERRETLSAGGMNRDTCYLAYVGDTAILASDWYSLRDCLTRLAGKGETLASNEAFKRSVAEGGDVIYLSDPMEIFGSAAKKSQSPRVTERGTLRLSNTGWQSSFDLTFGSAGLLKSFSFKPAVLKSPSTLLPRSTTAYLLMNFDFSTAWRWFSSDVFGAETAKKLAEIWSLDFEHEIVPELGPECGAVLLDIPSFKGEAPEAPWAMFIQIKSDKLAKSFAEGKLIKGATAAAKAVKVRIGSTNYWLTLKNGFLIFANSEAAIGKFDSREYLASAREYDRALKAAPAEVVALGGCNIDAAITNIPPASDPAAAEGLDLLFSFARAFHSLNLYAQATDGGLNARLSVSLDREGRYSVSELASLSKDFQFAAAEVEARGVPITDQQRIDSLVIRITSKAAGAPQRLKEDLTSSAQSVDVQSNGDVVLTVKPRRASPSAKVELPVAASEMTAFVKPTGTTGVHDQTVVAQAREIAGNDRDAWSVARKLADWTFKNLTWKRVDGASAASTLATREADCLEFSELFVAMARTLGLPARIVSGLVHTGGSFGGHAWVEVWVGEWVELDPTWGTNFVDATHIRSASSELLTYSALNVVGIEVVEARRGVPEFQKNPKALVEAICEDLSGKGNEALSIALDPAVLIDSLMGDGAWSGMNSSEREQIYSVNRRLIANLHTNFGDQLNAGPQTRLLRLEQNRNEAQALVLSHGFASFMLKLELIRKGDEWFVKEMTQEDFAHNTIAEAVTPTVLLIQAKRRNSPPPKILRSAEWRIIQARNSDPKLAIEIANQALLEQPENKHLRYLKAVCLLEGLEADKEKIDQAVAILSALSNEQPSFPPAVRLLGEHFAETEDDDADLKGKQEKAIGYLQQYATLAPADPRPHLSLAAIYEARNENDRAEAEYRLAIQLDPFNPNNYSDVAKLLMSESRFKEALAAIDQSQGRGQSKDEMFANLMFTGLETTGASERAEALAAAAPERLGNNFRANINLASLRIGNDRARDALPLLKRAGELDPKSSEPHALMNTAYRKLHSWIAALKSADSAIALDAENADAYYGRACALAQLRRLAEAIVALKKAIELGDEYSSEGLENEPDLKPLAATPGFRKLIEELKKSETEQNEPPKKAPEKHN
jgi:tetratricopeptide (TPR) repeat protein